MKQSSPELPSPINREVWEENIRAIATSAVAHFEQAHGPLSQARRAVAYQAAWDALNAQERTQMKRAKDVLEAMFDTAEQALFRVVPD